MEEPTQLELDSQFENLPLDIQKEIIFKSGEQYQLNKKLYKSSEGYRELRCLRSISEREITRTLSNNNTNTENDTITFIVEEYIPDYHGTMMFRLNSDNYETDMGFRIGSRYNVTIDDSEDVIDAGYEYYSEFEYRSDTLYIVDQYNSYKISYNDIFLLPSSITTILTKRGELCQKHIREVMLNYIKDKYEKLMGHELSVVGWLIYCLIDIGVNLENYINNFEVRSNDTENERYKFVINEEYATVLKDTLYELLINNLLLY